MKPQEFIKLLRRVIREEVTDVVSTEVRRILNEEIDSVKMPVREQTQAKQTKRPLIPREYPLVTMDDFLNETRQNMAGFDDGSGFESMSTINSAGEQEFDPELAIAPSQTAHLVKDYSSLLKRADEIANNSRG
jgi:hypothetical protein